MFATTRGTVRRNKLSDFVDVRRSGIIAMKLDEGEAIVDVQICTERDDVLLTAGGGQCIRFAVHRSARVPGPHLHGRARHRARRGRQGDLAVDPAPCGGDRRGARRPISSAPTRCGAASTAARRRKRRPTPRRRRSRARRDRARRAALRGNVGGRAVRADHFRARLRQALLVLRIPDHRPRRQRHRRHGRARARRHHTQEDRQAGRLVPGRGGRPDHAGDRRRPAHPHAASKASASPAARPRA